MNLTLLTRPTPASRPFRLDTHSRKNPQELTPEERVSQSLISSLSNAIHLARTFLAMVENVEDRKALRECIEDIQDIREDAKDIRRSLLMDREINRL